MKELNTLLGELGISKVKLFGILLNPQAMVLFSSRKTIPSCRVYNAVPLIQLSPTNSRLCPFGKDIAVRFSLPRKALVPIVFIDVGRTTRCRTELT